MSDGHGLVAAGRITRVIVERARFMEKAAGRLTRALAAARRDASRQELRIAASHASGFSNCGE